MMLFFNRNWAGVCLGRLAGPGLKLGWSAGYASSGLGLDRCCADRQALSVILLCKKESERRRVGEGFARGRSDA